MRALLVIDVQNDFCPGGALPAPEGDRIVPVINRLMEKFALIIASKDWHPEVTSHFDRWPRHCIQGSKGAELHPELTAGRIDRIVLKGAGNMDEGYSIFAGIDIDLESFLKEREIDTLYITGLVTEYCVKETALDARKKGFHTYVVSDAVRGVEQRAGDGARAFAEMARAGVRIVSSDQIE